MRRPGLTRDLDQEARKRGKVLRTQARGPEAQDDEQLEVRPRPDVKPGSVSTAAAKGAVTALVGSVAAKGIPKKLAPAPVLVADYVLTPLTGAAKAVSSEVERLRQARDEWTGETMAAAEARLDELFGATESMAERRAEAELLRQENERLAGELERVNGRVAELESSSKRAEAEIAHLTNANDVAAQHVGQLGDELAAARRQNADLGRAPLAIVRATASQSVPDPTWVRNSIPRSRASRRYRNWVI